MIKIECWLCEQTLVAPGALYFGVPHNGLCEKRHMCVRCDRLLGKTLRTLKYGHAVPPLVVYDSTVEAPLQFTPDVEPEPFVDPREGNSDFDEYDRNGFAPGGWE